MIAWLIEELIDLGHQVTLFASGDSSLVQLWSPAALGSQHRLDWQLASSRYGVGCRKEHCDGARSPDRAPDIGAAVR